jgi:hypothetical protein
MPTSNTTAASIVWSATALFGGRGRPTPASDIHCPLEIGTASAAPRVREVLRHTRRVPPPQVLCTSTSPPPSSCRARCRRGFVGRPRASHAWPRSWVALNVMPTSSASAPSASR